MEIGIYYKPQAKEHARFGGDSFFRIADHGFSAIDYDLSRTEDDFYTLDLSEAKKMFIAEKNAAELAGLRISQIHGPWRWPPRDTTEEDRADRLKHMKRSIELASAVECKYWVVHPIMPYGINELGTVDAPKTHALNLSFMTELLEHAKPLGVTICLENMPMKDFSMATPERILEFVREIDDDGFKICLDTGHVAVFHDRGLRVGDEVRRLGGEIKVLHVHDNMGNADSHMLPTEGIIDWTDFVKSLYEIGFDGVFSLETAPSEALDNEAFDAECRKLYGMIKKMTSL